jgi:hypothetical protein
MVSVPAPDGVRGTVHYRRYPTGEPFREVPMSREGAALAALLPSQAPAGKLEYSVTLAAPEGDTRIPEGEPIVMRFKGDVPAGVLIPHVVFMFLSMLIGVRAALAALLARPEAKRYAWVTLVGITVGGMVLGPLVQKYAFGAWWTGWPLGHDLTDNKTAVMWLAWIASVAVLSRRRSPADPVARSSVVLACLVTIAVYLVPHSLRGSQIDYGRVDGRIAGTFEPSTGPVPERGDVAGTPGALGDARGREVGVGERRVGRLHELVELAGRAPHACGRAGNDPVAHRYGTSGRPGCRLTNWPRPFWPFHWPWSTSTSPRDSTIAGVPFTLRPS